MFAQQILSGDFEEWELNGFNIKEPIGWDTQNEPDLIYVEQVHGYSGMYAACLNVIWDPMIQSFTGAVLSAQMNLLESGQLRTFKGYYSAQSITSDSLQIKVELFAGDFQIGKGQLMLGSSLQDWSEFSLDLKYYNNKSPDFAIITFAAIPDKGGLQNSKFFIDDLEFEY